MENKKVGFAFLAVLVLVVVGIVIFTSGDEDAPYESTPDPTHQNYTEYTPTETYVPEWKRIRVEQTDPLGYVFIGGERFGISETELFIRGENLQNEDILPLAYMVNLEMLSLTNNQISDLSPLAGLGNLQSLWLEDNEISDLSPLAGLKNLHGVALSRNEINDLSPLVGLQALILLQLDGNQITDVSPIAEISSLWLLYMNDNPIGDFSVLSQLPYLNTLLIDNTQIDDISFLDEFETLYALQARNNSIRNTAPLAGLENLRILYLCNNEISDPTPLANLDLYILGLSGNPIQNWPPLQRSALVEGRPPAPGQVVYSLSRDFVIGWHEVGFSTDWGTIFTTYPFSSPLISQNSHPLITIVDGPYGKGIKVSERGASWYALDLLTADSALLNFEENDYHIEVLGRNNSEHIVTIALIATESPWNALHDKEVPPGETFTLSGELSLAIMDDTIGGRNQFMPHGIRLQTHCTADFTIYEIIISAR
ncbi:MAG: leucine-rich repeat domain-containing protein [Defluviitaleaceae bacterium]|nr:leucine-rich repeat domain-containing protein [Defluviitaleaceae bacterium]